MNGLIEMQFSQLKEVAKDIPEFKSDKLKFEIENNLGQGNRKKSDEVFRMLRLCCDAVEAINSDNDAVRGSAAKVVKSFRDPFDNLKRNAFGFNAILENLHKSEYYQELPGCRKREDIILTNGFRLSEIQTLQRLRDIGRKLDICVKKEKTAIKYLDRVRSESIRLWGVFSGSGEPQALLSIDMDNDTVDEFDYLSDDDDELTCLSQNDLLEILVKLDVTADRISEFVKSGAFSKFKVEIPFREPVKLSDGRQMWVWRYDDQIIVSLDKYPTFDKKIAWSLFKKVRPRSWDDRGIRGWEYVRGSYLDCETLIGLLVDNPKLVSKFSSKKVSTN